MSEPQRPINTFHAFCSFLLPGLGQLLQKRPAAAFGYCVLFLLSAFLPAIIVTLLFVDRFSQETLWVHVLHILVFALVCIPLMVTIFSATIDIAKWKPDDPTRFKPLHTLGALLCVALVVYMLLPQIPRARPAARRAQCTSNMKQLGIAFNIYYDTYGHFPPAYTVDEDGKPLHSWRVLILPFIEQEALYKEIRLNEPWDSEYNSQFHSKVPHGLRCPGVVNGSGNEAIPARGGCYYSVIVGEEAVFNGSREREMNDLSNGTSRTILVVERRTPVNWMDPTHELPFAIACEGVNVNALGISSYHEGGVNCVFFDGCAQFLPDSTSSKKLRAMLVRESEERQR